ncbi:MAG: hypothetical protein ACI93R_001728 [Flavobacteriales bacterium]|jgi:hypothetical protein
MNIRFCVITFVTLLSLYSHSITALRMNQFSELCHSSLGECSDKPIVQTYVGGDLDILTVLEEQTGFLGPVYRKESERLFDVLVVIRFIAQRSEQYATSNGMLALVRYDEQQGGCQA